MDTQGAVALGLWPNLSRGRLDATSQETCQSSYSHRF